MAEPAPSKVGTPSSISIQITFSSNSYAPVPQSSSVENGGSVYFVCSKACWVWTIVDDELTDAFDSEENNYVACAPGNNGPFTPAISDDTITIVPLAVNSNPPNPDNITESVRGTIKVTTGMTGKEHRK
jgi:hypothetical protein